MQLLSLVLTLPELSLCRESGHSKYPYELLGKGFLQMLYLDVCCF